MCHPVPILEQPTHLLAYKASTPSALAFTATGKRKRENLHRFWYGLFSLALQCAPASEAPFCWNCKAAAAEQGSVSMVHLRGGRLFCALLLCFLAITTAQNSSITYPFIAGRYALQ